MKSSIEILDALSARLDGATDYRIAKITGIPTAKISAVRAGACSLSRVNCKRAALTLGVEPGALIAIVQAEREEDPEIRESLLRVATRAMVAAVLVAAVGLGGTPQTAEAAGTSVYYVKYPRIRRCRRWGRKGSHAIPIHAVKSR